MCVGRYLLHKGAPAALKVSRTANAFSRCLTVALKTRGQPFERLNVLLDSGPSSWASFFCFLCRIKSFRISNLELCGSWVFLLFFPSFVALGGKYFENKWLALKFVFGNLLPSGILLKTVQWCGVILIN